MGNGRARAVLGLEELLGRPLVDVADDRFGAYVAGATVLVTGAGGSVGAALCARLARRGAGALILVDQAEAALLDVVAALREGGFGRATPVLADIRSARRVAAVLDEHGPDAVFHAAAYKQVPLLEAHPVEGLATNVLGTRHVVAAARRAGVERLVLFSTDKAVAPTNVLGRTKAVAEWIVAAGGREDGRRYTSVRLGNVVDSVGSVLPRFREQLERGGPLTVTHADATRYLMTADEAAGLALVAGGLGDPDGALWLDVGRPLRVLDLARRLVAASGRAAPIELVGLRPGERLHERLYRTLEEVRPTACPAVYRSEVEAVDPAWLESRLGVLARHVHRASAAGALALLAELQPAAAEPDLSQAGVAG